MLVGHGGVAAADAVSVPIALGWLFSLVLAFVLGAAHAHRDR
ncbi:hypothetical protein [Actinocatenispora sera]|nr:hypothetical protein [Actinocatenispora sera]